MTKKKLLALALSLVMALSLAACSNSSNDQVSKGTPNPVVSDEQNPATQQPQKAPSVDTGKITPDPVDTEPEATETPTVTDDTVTAESLVNGGVLTDADSMDVNVTMNYVVQMDASDMLGESGGSMQMEMGIQLNLDVQAEKDAATDEARSHLYGTIALQMFGMDYSDVMESYRVNYEDGSCTVYDWDSETFTWSKSTEDGGSDDGLSGFYGLSTLDASVIDNLEMLEPHDGESIYTVIGSISLANICSATGMEPGDMFVGMLDATEDVPMDMVYDVIFTYDAGTRQLISIYFSLDPDSVPAQEGVSIDSFTMNYVINSVNDVKVTIPQEVLEGATDAVVFDDLFTGELDSFTSDDQN